VSPDTLEVKFTGGELIPQPTQNIQEWLTVFGQRERKSELSFRDRIMSFIIKWMFGIERVSDIETQTGRQTFAMNKSPKGKLKLLYLDEELRITKGNRETVLICKRQNNY
jgi:hypothetical protein